jgi:hypothetical protein
MNDACTLYVRVTVKGSRSASIMADWRLSSSVTGCHGGSRDDVRHGGRHPPAVALHEDRAAVGAMVG